MIIILEKNNIYFGDNLELLKQLEDNSIDSCVSDFPYNLSFMGKKWDTIPNYQDWCYQRAKELYRVLKPGGYCLVFGGTRTHHRLVCAFEDAGFEIRDEIMWLYGSGFPKSYNISKGFDKKAGAEREIISYSDRNDRKLPSGQGGLHGNTHEEYREKGREQTKIAITAPSTDIAKQWEGWGTALKPAHEPIMVAQKPIEENYCHNVEKWGVGGLNIDDSRIEYDSENEDFGKSNDNYNKNDGFGFYEGAKKQIRSVPKQEGRFPANVILDEEAGEMLDEQSGELKSGGGDKSNKKPLNRKSQVMETIDQTEWRPDSGGASRFFYCPKANKKDRTENNQIENTCPTVKPTDLIKYLVRLVTPPNGNSLDICLGSGTHAKACLLLSKEGYPVNYIGFENDEENFEIAKHRIEINKNSEN